MSVRQKIKRGQRHQKFIDAYNDRDMRNTFIPGDLNKASELLGPDPLFNGKNVFKWKRNRERGLNRERRRLEERYGQ